VGPFQPAVARSGRHRGAPGAPLDNNLCESVLKRVILHRKNSLFYKTANGAHVGDVFMSLIHTAEMCGANPFDYLTAVQRHSEAVAQHPEQWMPWNYTEALALSERAALDAHD
jgi:transposase